MSRPARGPRGEPGDADLLRRLRDGDRTAVDDLCDRVGAPALALARRVLADDAAADDVVHDVLVSVWRDPVGPPGPESADCGVAAWVLALVHQRAVDAARRGAGRARRAPGTAGPDAAPDGEPVLAALPDEQRAVLALTCYGGHTDREVAALTGMPLDAVRAGLLDGVRRVRQERDGVARVAAGGAPARADGASR